MGKRLLGPKASYLLNNDRGQFAIETVLIALITVGAFISATNTIREEKLLAKLIESPWASVNGMIECGEWGPKKSACANHPGQRKRVLSYQPK